MFIDKVGNYGTLPNLRFIFNYCNIIEVAEPHNLQTLLGDINTKQSVKLLELMYEFYKNATRTDSTGIL